MMAAHLPPWLWHPAMSCLANPCEKPVVNVTSGEMAVLGVIAILAYLLLGSSKNRK